MIHGWDGFPENHWFPWLKEKLEELGFDVITPQMPSPEKPTIEIWIPFLKKIVGTIDKNTFFVGHSIGCQAIMRYLETVDTKSKVGGIVFVAGFFHLPFLKTRAEKIIAKPWLETPINTDMVRKHALHITAIFSDDDPDVSVDDAVLFKERLTATIIVEKNKGHFTSEQGVEILPSALDSIKEMIA
ncbi:MAG: alpha/beta hydrolase [Nanoarchaeota archaeon]|nr:alpha/beta hydrolase [Nanoarchaeota archaeon]